MSSLRSDNEDALGREPADSNYHIVPSSSYEDDDDDDVNDINLTGVAPAERQTIGNADVEAEKITEPVAAMRWHPAVTMMVDTMKKLLSPFVRILFTPKAQRTMVKMTVTAVLLVWILLTSMAAYLTFYQQYVPRTAHIEPIYFQYETSAGSAPVGIVDLTEGAYHYAPLRHEQAYDVSVKLHVPTSTINFDIGNFMVTTELQTSGGSRLAYASRPAILRYQSNTQRVLHVVAKALPLLLGLTEESQSITIPLMENFVEQRGKPTTRAIVTLSNPRLQVYNAELRIHADFRGLRYYMYYHRISTAFTFITVFAGIELIFAAIAWTLFGQALWDKLQNFFEGAADEIQAIQENYDKDLLNQTDQEEDEEEGEEEANERAKLDQETAQDVPSSSRRETS
ncbi:putative adipose-regulatory protein-domain-containing protein [Radiomyces spectabilis]|uniref:putative adipose-regulatory protein-domain-containing protein n=1 Tax=Radiomyces spectabilis TaxID=64574 RepID=UPI002220FF94|nr:putative adipose-regulatory protein-domain-containing protein [Radiomyces spectabilis]KAI8373075.1 putative adipose-regulatory protein-domain-containing protein [Radiomyces spectabilis]